MKKKKLLKKILENPTKILAKAIEADENNPLLEGDIVPSRIPVEEEMIEAFEESEDVIHAEIEDEFRQLEQPMETISPHETSRKEVPFSVISKLGEGKKLNNILHGTTAKEDFAEPMGKDYDSADYTATRCDQD